MILPFILEPKPLGTLHHKFVPADTETEELWSQLNRRILSPTSIFEKESSKICWKPLLEIKKLTMHDTKLALG